MSGPLLPLIALLPVLAIVAVMDLRRLRIPNFLPILALVIFGVGVLIYPPADLVGRMIVAFVTLAAGFFAFALRMVGGGDVKMLAALMLFIPVQAVYFFANVFALSLILGIVLVLGLRRVIPAEGHDWAAFSGTNKFPMGVSIAMAGYLFVAVGMTL